MRTPKIEIIGSTAQALKGTMATLTHVKVYRHRPGKIHK